jgi:hypothetical protein
MQKEDTEDMQNSLSNIMIDKAAQQGDTMDNDDQDLTKKNTAGDEDREELEDDKI